ncbi:MAG: hypothetical protein AB1749_10485 [Pseudomonadota bacterium]
MAAVLLVIRVEAPEYALATATSSADLTSGLAEMSRSAASKAGGQTGETGHQLVVEAVVVRAGRVSVVET